MIRLGYIVTVLAIFVFSISCRKESVSGNGASPASSIIIPDKEGMTVKGTVLNSSTREPLCGVMVSDGRLCTLTDEEGIYYLPTDLKTQRCVFVCVPSGYQVPMNTSGCFSGWKSLVSGTPKDVYQINFSLTPEKDKSGSYRMIFCGDPQIRTGDLSIQSYEYVTQGIADYSSTADVPLYVVNLGDLVFNEVSIYSTYMRYVSISSVPTFNLPGNHDHDPSRLTEYDAISEYIRTLGPNNYSVNIGKIHYVFLDSVAWGMSGTDYYASGFDDEALMFLENDLKYVSKETPVFICTHVPMAKTQYNFAQGRYNFSKFNNIIAGYDVHMWSGHYHINYMYSYTSSDIAAGRTKARSMESHIVVRCTGALFMDKEISSDGIPRGFVVMDVNGTEVTWHYHPIGNDYGNGQMLVYTPEMTGDEYVYANIFLWDNLWGDVEWWEDGVMKGNMDKADGTDPMYVKLYLENGMVGSVPEDTDTRHLFRIVPSSGAVSGEVRVKDRFGNIWKQEVDL